MVVQSIIPTLDVAIWKILSRLRSLKQNLEDLLLAKDVTNEKGLPNGKPFYRVPEPLFCNFLNNRQFIAWEINAPYLTIVIQLQNMITLTMDTSIIVDGELVLLIYAFVVWYIFVPPGNTNMFFSSK